MHTNNQKLTSIQETLLSDFIDVLNDTRKLANNSLLDFELGVLQHTYFDKATASSLEADMRLLLPELETLSRNLQELQAKADELSEQLADYIGD